MTEWQPAIFIDAHRFGNDFTRSLHGKRIRVKKSHDISGFCDASQCYEIHPEDIGKVESKGCCEHEILTD